jgi:hypothetical protein
MDVDQFQEQVTETRNWIADHLDRKTLKFPSDDDVWAFITTTWPRISTHNAERLLGEAMKNIPMAA